MDTILKVANFFKEPEQKSWQSAVNEFLFNWLAAAAVVGGAALLLAWRCGGGGGNGEAWARWLKAVVGSGLELLLRGAEAAAAACLWAWRGGDGKRAALAHNLNGLKAFVLDIFYAIVVAAKARKAAPASNATGAITCEKRKKKRVVCKRKKTVRPCQRRNSEAYIEYEDSDEEWQDMEVNGVVVAHDESSTSLVSNFSTKRGIPILFPAINEMKETIGEVMPVNNLYKKTKSALIYVEPALSADMAYAKEGKDKNKCEKIVDGKKGQAVENAQSLGMRRTMSYHSSVPVSCAGTCIPAPVKGVPERKFFPVKYPSSF